MAPGPLVISLHCLVCVFLCTCTMSFVEMMVFLQHLMASVFFFYCVQRSLSDSGLWYDKVVFIRYSYNTSIVCFLVLLPTHDLVLAAI